MDLGIDSGGRRREQPLRWPDEGTSLSSPNISQQQGPLAPFLLYLLASSGSYYCCCCSKSSVCKSMASIEALEADNPFAVDAALIARLKVSPPPICPVGATTRALVAGLPPSSHDWSRFCHRRRPCRGLCRVAAADLPAA